MAYKSQALEWHELRKSGLYCDFTLSTLDSTIPVHRIVLRTVPFFKSALAFSPDDYNVTFPFHVSESDFDLFVEFLYCESYEQLPKENRVVDWLSLCILADYCSLFTLAHKCLHRLLKDFYMHYSMEKESMILSLGGLESVSECVEFSQLHQASCVSTFSVSTHLAYCIDNIRLD